MTRLQAAAVVALTFASAAAFTPAASSFASRSCSLSTSSSSLTWSPTLTTTTFLQMSEAENTEQQAALEENVAESEKEKTEEPKVDPVVTELKETISKLELSLKSKRSELNNLKDMADRYSQSGYARQVAQVENNKRMRRDNMADSKSAARATVLQSFLPVLDEMDAIAAKYEGNAFAGTLRNGLTSEFQNTLKNLGVEEFSVASGDDVVLGRVVAVEEKYSEEFGKGTVIAPLKSGLEIQGNIVRPAECVASLGSEAEEKAEEAAAAEVEEKEEEEGDGSNSAKTSTE